MPPTGHGDRSVFNLSIGAGALLGSQMGQHLGLGSLPPSAAALAGLALWWTLWAQRRWQMVRAGNRRITIQGKPGFLSIPVPLLKPALSQTFLLLSGDDQAFGMGPAYRSPAWLFLYRGSVPRSRVGCQCLPLAILTL